MVHRQQFTGTTGSQLDTVLHGGGGGDRSVKALVSLTSIDIGKLKK